MVKADHRTSIPAFIIHSVIGGVVFAVLRRHPRSGMPLLLSAASARDAAAQSSERQPSVPPRRERCRCELHMQIGISKPRARIRSLDA